MTRSVQPFVLSGTSSKVELDPASLDSDTAGVAARFWAGKHEGSSAKAACVERIAAVWRDRKRVAEVMATLRPEERAVLAVVKRFGGFISGTLLQRELLARGVLRATEREEIVSYRRRQLSADPVLALCERLVLVREPGYYSSYSSYGLHRNYPSVSLPSQLAAFIEPAASLEWKASAPAQGAPGSTSMRAFAEVLVDLEQTARALEGQGGWKVNHGGGLPAAARNRLAKLRPAIAGDAFDPPDRVALDYSLLCALGAVESDGAIASLERERADQLFRRPPEAQAWEWIRAWMRLRLWQDGIGAVPDRESRDNPTRIDPDRLRQGRETLVWALTRVAHSENEDWLDLETFLLDLHAASGERGLSFYWEGFAWQPHFAAAARKEDLEAGPERTRAFWMDREGVWAANALLSTFVYLGVVERGRSGGARSTPSFRLTELGRAVFGAPEVELKRAAVTDPCLTVQPNHEVLLYLDGADGEVVTTLGRIASRESAAGLVQTFKLTRESVYAALEGGLTATAIESFLSSRSRNGLPANVSHSLAEWSRKREALVVRGAVALGAGLPEGQCVLRGRSVGAQFIVASQRAAAKGAKDLHVPAESGTPSREWKVDEHGVVSPGGPISLVGKARLRRFASFTQGRWQVTPESVRAARDLGISADQILEWLRAHSSQEVPPILATAIWNWAGGRGGAFLGEVVLLQVDDPKAFDALRGSERLRPFVKGMLAPGCFAVAAEMREEAAKLLRDLGFSLGSECKLASVREAPHDDERLALVKAV
jgi:hypothetical protein